MREREREKKKPEKCQPAAAQPLASVSSLPSSSLLGYFGRGSMCVSPITGHPLVCFFASTIYSASSVHSMQAFPHPLMLVAAFLSGTRMLNVSLSLSAYRCLLVVLLDQRAPYSRPPRETIGPSALHWWAALFMRLVSFCKMRAAQWRAVCPWDPSSVHLVSSVFPLYLSPSS